jgi:prolyl oligopeptidase
VTRLGTTVPSPPPCRRDDVVDVLHARQVPDPYRWLEDGESAETRAWVASQNARTRQALDALPDRSGWHERLVALMRLPVTASCEVRGERLFVSDRPAGAEQIRLAMRSSVECSPGHSLFEPDQGVADSASAIDWYEPSPDGSFVALGVSEGGTENSELRVLRVDTGESLADRIPHTRAASIAWLPDSSGFRYTRYPEDSEYDRKVYLHRLGDDWADDPLVWGDLPTPETWPDVSASADGRYVLVHAMVGWGRVEAHLLDVEVGVWRTVIEGVEAVSEFRFGGDGLVGVTTLGAPKGRLVTVSCEQPGVEHWRELVPEGDAVRGRFVVVGDAVVSVATHGAIDRVERHSVSGGALLGGVGELGVVSVVDLDGDIVNGEPLIVLVLSGFTAPTRAWRWTPSAGLEAWEAGEDDAGDDGFGRGADLPELVVRHERYRSLDGTEIGAFVINRADVTPVASTPTILNGYGGFAITETPVWSPLVAAWCERGGQYTIAGLRGGYEEGETWHHAGRRANKQNVFDDFHAAGDWLVDGGQTSRERLGIAGGSNGGLLVGAALTQRPDAYRAVWCAVPLLDMIRFPQFLIARLWTDEYGDPEISEEFEWLFAYSPYHHVHDGVAYPAVLLTTAEGDSRVDPMHARKMAALLQHSGRGQDRRPVLLHQEGRAGHGVGKPVAKRADEQADVLAFFAWQLGDEPT